MHSDEDFDLITSSLRVFNETCRLNSDTIIGEKEVLVYMVPACVPTTCLGKPPPEIKPVEPEPEPNFCAPTTCAALQRMPSDVVKDKLNRTQIQAALITANTRTLQPRRTFQQSANESEPAEGEAAEGEPAEGEPAEGGPAEGEPAEGEPVQGEPVQAEPVQAEPVAAEPVEEAPAAPEAT